MKNIKEIPVPDIGDFDEVEVIEILVSAGDQVEAEDSLISLESDKATMEIPSPEAGIVKEVKVSIGDKVSLGNVILLLESSAAAEKPEMHRQWRKLLRQHLRIFQRLKLHQRRWPQTEAATK